MAGTSTQGCCGHVFVVRLATLGALKVILILFSSSTLQMIGDFAKTQADRTRFIRVMNTVGDGNKIREFRERLAQAMNRFKVGFSLRSRRVSSLKHFHFFF